MHEHIKGIIENILNLIAQSKSLYSSIKQDNITDMNRAALNSIIQSKENTIKLLYDEYKKINPDYEIKSYDTSEEAPDVLQSKIHNIEAKIISAVDNELLQNIPSKSHDGIFTTAQNIKSNSEASIIKMDPILNARSSSSESYLDLIKTTYYIVKAMKLYEKAGIEVQLKDCSSILNENKLILKERYGKNLILYTPQYGDSYAKISKNFGISLLQLITQNHIKNPYAKPFADNIIIVTDDEKGKA